MMLLVVDGMGRVDNKGEVSYPQEVTVVSASGAQRSTNQEVIGQKS